MKSFFNNISTRTKIFILSIFLFLALFALSSVLRVSNPGQAYVNSDATYHVVLTMQAFDSNPISVHHFLPIQTFSGDINTYIDNGPSLIQDESGYNFYVSFSPIGFYLPYFFCKIFNLPLTTNSLYIFNCVLLFICAIIMGIIIYVLFENEFLAIFSSIVYLFIPEVLYTQGIVYWHHSISQVFLLLQVLFFILLFIKKWKQRMIYPMFFIVSFLYPYSEWTGYVSNVGMALGVLILGMSKNQNNKLSISKQALASILGLAFISIFALVYYFLRFLPVAKPLELIDSLFSRASARQNYNVLLLLKGYIKSFLPLIVMILILYTFALIDNNSRKELKNYFTSKPTIICLIIMIFPLLENFIMYGHAVVYTFDRLKLSLVLIYLLCISIQSLNSSIRLFKSVVEFVCTFILMIWGLSTYSNGKTTKIEGYEDTLILKEYLDENFLCDERNLLVKVKWRSWGYLQTLYQRNIYCTEYYSDEELKDIARKQGSRYIVYLKCTYSYDDTSAYSEAVVLNIVTNELWQYHVEEGKIVYKADDTHIFPLTDDNWNCGILRLTGDTLLFPDDDYYHSLIVNATKVISGNEEFTILEKRIGYGYIQLLLDRDAAACAYPNLISFE